MQREQDLSAAPVITVANLYGAHSAPSWSDWNSTSGGQGYWLLGTSVLLVIVGVVMVTSKPRNY
jgi:hypothetical protein